jgi:hypothetical protein
MVFVQIIPWRDPSADCPEDVRIKIGERINAAIRSEPANRISIDKVHPRTWIHLIIRQGE